MINGKRGDTSPTGVIVGLILLLAVVSIILFIFSARARAADNAIESFSSCQGSGILNGACMTKSECPGLAIGGICSDGLYCCALEKGQTPTVSAATNFGCTAGTWGSPECNVEITAVRREWSSNRVFVYCTTNTRYTPCVNAKARIGGQTEVECTLMDGSNLEGDGTTAKFDCGQSKESANIPVSAVCYLNNAINTEKCSSSPSLEENFP